jgi:ABC-2 type transport system permease protein
VRNAVAPDGRIAPLGLDQVEQYIFANKDWVLNALEYLTDNSGLMATRAKEVRLRPLDPVRVREGRSTWPLLAIVAPVLLLALLGLVYNVVRWRRYGMRPEA